MSVARGIKAPGIIHGENGILSQGMVMIVYAPRTEHDVLSLTFGEQTQIAVAYVNVEKAVQAAKNAWALGKVNKAGLAVEKVNAVGMMAPAKDKRAAKEGTVTVCVTSDGKEQRLSLSFNNSVEIMVDLAPILLLADQNGWTKLTS